jgi:hypothetical protein
MSAPPHLPFLFSFLAREVGPPPPPKWLANSCSANLTKKNSRYLTARCYRPYAEGKLLPLIPFTTPFSSSSPLFGIFFFLFLFLFLNTPAVSSHWLATTRTPPLRSFACPPFSEISWLFFGSSFVRVQRAPSAHPQILQSVFDYNDY